MTAAIAEVIFCTAHAVFRYYALLATGQVLLIIAVVLSFYAVWLNHRRHVSEDKQDSI